MTSDNHEGGDQHVKYLEIGTDVAEPGGDFEDAELSVDGSRVKLKMRLTEEQTRDLRDLLNRGLGDD